MGYMVAQLNSVPEDRDFYITYTGWPGFNTYFEQIARTLGRNSVIVNLYGDESVSIKGKMEQLSNSLRGHLVQNASYRGTMDILYITAVRADRFSNEDYGIAICREGNIDEFNERCLRLPQLLSALQQKHSGDNLSQNEILWKDIFREINQLFGNCIFPIGTFTYNLARIK